MQRCIAAYFITNERSALSYLLSVTTSTRADQSWSLRVHDAFVEQFRAAHPTLDHVVRSTATIPHLTDETQRAGRTPVGQRTPEQVTASALATTLTDELVDASALVIATPMYNWGPPSSLKAWIDHVVNARTFYSGDHPLADIPVSIIVASGGFYSSGDTMVHDHLRPLLREFLTRIGATDIQFIDCDPTGPMDRGLVSADAPESGFQQALRQVPAAVTRRRA